MRDMVKCSFCGKSQSQVKKVIAGPDGVYICNECVDLCQDILDEQLLSPRERPTGLGWSWKISVDTDDEAVREQIAHDVNAWGRMASRIEYNECDLLTGRPLRAGGGASGGASGSQDPE